MIFLATFAAGILINAAILIVAFRLAAPPTADDTPEARYRRYEARQLPPKRADEMTPGELAAAVRDVHCARIAAKAAGIPYDPPLSPFVVLEGMVYRDH